LIHQPLGGCKGQASEIEIEYREIQKVKQELYEVLALNTGQEYDRIYADADRDHWFTAIEAKEYGLVDDVIYKKQY
jgi:ATP-dependent Clp protease protease subunit